MLMMMMRKKSAVLLFDRTSLSTAAVTSAQILLLCCSHRRPCAPCRWPRSTWTTCCARPCPTPSTAPGTGCGPRATRPCWPSSTGRPSRSCRSTPAARADSCWTHSDCAARRWTEGSAEAELPDCSDVLEASFNASFKTCRLFDKEKGAVPWQQITGPFFFFFLRLLVFFSLL